MTGIAQRTISGIVTDQGGEPLIGASVLVKATDIGTVTDFDGSYSLDVPADAGELIISYTGYAEQTITLGASNVVDVTLAEGVALQEVVVTGLGIKREEKALGYAVQKVGGDDINKSGASSAVDALVGKAAGVQITRSSGSVGAGSRIVIRGASSLTGNNQPLIVIDGVRTNNESLNSNTSDGSGSTAGTATSNRLMDLNNDDIESINILKGAAATALYGTAGAAGVVIITTKKGASGKGLNINYTTQVAFDEISQIIDLQNTYAQGSGGNWRDPSTGASGSWGPKMTDLEFATDPNHPNAPNARAFDAEGNFIYDNNGFLVPRGTGNGRAAIVYNNVDDFFKTAISSTNSLSLSGGGKVANFRLSASHLDANGVIPREEYDRTTVKLASEINPFDNLKIGGSVNFSKSNFVRVQQGSNTSGLLLGMLRTPVSFDNANGFDAQDAVNEPSSYIFPNFNQRNYRGGGGYDNPYWTVNNALGFEDVSRVFGNVNVNYTLNKWANLSFVTGYDVTSDVRKQEFDINSRTESAGAIFHNEFNTQIYDNILSLNGGSPISEDFTFDYSVGVNVFSFNTHRTNVEGRNLVFPGFRDISNAQSLASFEDIDKYRTVGFFGSFNFDYRRLIYVTISGRQDYDSRLGDPANFNLGNTGFFYPSISSSFVFSDLLENDKVLSFGKLRVSWAQVGGPPTVAYSTNTVYTPKSIGDGWGDAINWPIQGVTSFGQSALLGNNQLRPELTTSVELGLEMRFLNRRVGFDVAYYQSKGEDMILDASVSPSTGFNNAWLNAGEMTSRGVELTIDAIPFQTKNFTWTTQLNFTKSETIVDRLAPGIERLFLTGFSSAGTYLVAGNQYGAIFGGAYQREETGTAADQSLNIPGGQIVINDDPSSSEYGFEAVDPTQRAIGNPNPDFIIGWNNSFTYKNFSFNFLLDWREGGDMWNGTAWALSFFGRTPITVDGREEAPTPIPGVLSDGTPNNIPVTRGQNYWTSSVGGFGSVGEQFVEDGGWIRLREVGLSYRIPKVKWFKGGSIGVSGRNLWLQTDYDGIDPETSLTGTGNGQGFDYFNMPATRSVMVNLSVNF